MQNQFQQFHLRKLKLNHQTFDEFNFDETDFCGLLFPQSNISAKVVITKFTNPFSGIYSVQRAFCVSSSIPIIVTGVEYSVTAMNGDGKSFYQQNFTHDFDSKVVIFPFTNELRSIEKNLFKSDNLNFILDTHDFDPTVRTLQFIA